MKDKPVQEKKNLDKGLKRSVGKPACCVSKGGSSSNTTSLPDQLARDKGFEKRAQYYAAKAYSRQSSRYANLQKIFFIAISNCILFPDKSNYVSSHTIRDDETNEHDLQDFQFVFIELPKFPKNKVEQLTSTVERWCYFFSATWKVMVLWWLNSIFPDIRDNVYLTFQRVATSGMQA